MKRKVPRLKTDRRAEAFLAQDLSGLDFSQFKPAKFEFEKKDDQDQYARTEAIAGGSEDAGESARHSLYALHSGNARTCHRVEVAPLPRPRVGASDGLGITSKSLGHVESDVALWLGIACPVDFPHTALVEQG